MGDINNLIPAPQTDLFYHLVFQNILFFFEYAVVMDNVATNLFLNIFTWIGRSGCIRFVITGSLLLLVTSLITFWDVPSSIQNIMLPILSWAWLMQFVKRGHDFGLPAWASLIACFTSFAVIPALFWAVMPGDDTYNKYGIRGTTS